MVGVAPPVLVIGAVTFMAVTGAVASAASGIVAVWMFAPEIVGAETSVIFGVGPPELAMLLEPVTAVTGAVTRAASGIVAFVIVAPDITGGLVKVLTPATV
jgi:hypothetical protein